MSVVVPLYNHAAYVETAVASILAQGSVVQEVVIIDDGSTDGSAAIAERLARQDARIAFRSQPNQGAHATINAGLRSCGGALLAILNSDDAYLPGRLAALAEALDADPAADLAASGIAFMDGQGRPVENPWHVEALAFHRAAQDMAVALANANLLVTTSNFLFRRALFEQVGPFAALRYAHDLDFALRALALGRRIVLLERPLLRYRIHAANTIAEDHGKVRAEWAMAVAAYLTTLWDRPGAPPVAWGQAAAMEGVLRRHELGRAAHLCMAYLRRHGATTLDASPLLADAAFRDQVAGWA